MVSEIRLCTQNNNQTNAGAETRAPFLLNNIFFDFAGCYNMTISDDAFSYLTGVTDMIFVWSKFSSLSSTAFTGMTSLH